MLAGLDVDDQESRGDHHAQLQSPTTSTFTTRTHRERLDDPSTSMLDLDDDPRSSLASDDYNGEQRSLDNSNELRRLSYLGPNLRFHSRAPWETDDLALDDEDQSRSILLSSKKAFGFSNSPRPSNVHRPSVESTRSQAKSKHSIETASSQVSYPRGALYALAQESLSTSSLGASMADAKAARSKFPLHRVRLDSPSNNYPSSPTATRSNHTPLNTSSPLNTPDTHTPTTSHGRPTYTADSIHPYANPDLIFQESVDQLNEGISRSDSVGTVIHSVTHTTLSKSDTRSTLAPATSTFSVNARHRSSTIQGRGISSPISVVNNTLRLDAKPNTGEESFFARAHPGADNLPDWNDRITSPGFSLISLEEARAQRTRSATAHPTVPLSPTPIWTPSIDVSPLDHQPVDSRGYEIDDGSINDQKARTRSTSAGARAKVTLQNIVGGGQSKVESDAGQGKTLKHKKSGFMRLFNGGRGQDREDKSSPPPLPSLMDAYAGFDASHREPKAMMRRIPVPDISSYLQEGSPSSPHSPVDVPVLTKPSPSSKRPIPTLSINTQPLSLGNRTPLAADYQDIQARTAPSLDIPQQPWLGELLPQSAPANVTEFPILKLRPVSTLFSGQFGDIVLSDSNPDSRPSLETDVDTPGSSTRVFSPITPSSFTLNTDPKLTPMPTGSDDQVTISALQEQILNTKLAWQRQIWELESQVRDLKAEVDDLRRADTEGIMCESCGRVQRLPPKVQTNLNRPARDTQNIQKLGVVNRPRARTGISSRFGNS
ncbi:hypothetical protein H0H92_003528 [Tricholoma furcatifolium]|nr:hypothetical protein H0H92_003528 [Tricholoma furcatifolium]